MCEKNNLFCQIKIELPCFGVVWKFNMYTQKKYRACLVLPKEPMFGLINYKFDLFKENASFVIKKLSSMCVDCICVNN